MILITVTPLFNYTKVYVLKYNYVVFLNRLKVALSAKLSITITIDHVVIQKQQHRNTQHVIPIQIRKLIYDNLIKEAATLYQSGFFNIGGESQPHCPTKHFPLIKREKGILHMKKTYIRITGPAAISSEGNNFFTSPKSEGLKSNFSTPPPQSGAGLTIFLFRRYCNSPLI